MKLDRRAFLNACASAGVASPLLPGIFFMLAAKAQEAGDSQDAELPKIIPEMIDQAAMLAGVEPFTAGQKKMLLEGLNDQRNGYAKIRALKLPNSVPPAYAFYPEPATKPEQSISHEAVPCIDAKLAAFAKAYQEATGFNNL